MTPELSPTPQAPTAARLELQLPSGLAVYGQILQLNGQVYNATSKVYEATNPANWASYVVPLTEVLPGSGVYFGEPPAGAGVGTRLLSLYQQAGTQPAPTDSLYVPPQGACPAVPGMPLAFVLEFSPASALISVALFAPKGLNQPLSLPARQDAVAIAQDILNKLYSARATLATKPYASINVNGEAVMYTSPDKLDQQIQFWERKVAVLSGKRRRFNSLRLDRF